MRANKQIAAGSGIRVYRRHSSDCDKSAAYIKCDCPLWIQFQRGGKQIRESAKTRDLEQALLLVKKVEKELKGEIPVTTKITIEDAVQKWLTHREQEGIVDDGRAKNMTRRLIVFCEQRQITSLSAVTKAHLTDFKLTLNLKSGNSNSLRISLSVVGTFFRWATEEAGYLTANPFPRFKLRFTPQEVIPPTDDEVNRVMADESVRLIASLMRYTGMAIRDAATLERTTLVGNLITGTRTKTAEPFRVRIPMWLADELCALPHHARYFFWDGKSHSQVTQRYRTLLTSAFAKAGADMTPHGFRHYFISTTLAIGVSVEDVSAMVGTSPNEIRKTYRHWIKEATDRLDRVQEQVWIAQGLDKDGNPISA
jgi:site-specific recombinase XerD